MTIAAITAVTIAAITAAEAEAAAAAGAVAAGTEAATATTAVIVAVAAAARRPSVSFSKQTFNNFTRGQARIGPPGISFCPFVLSPLHQCHIRTFLI